MRLILASSSPRRAALLSQIGYAFQVESPDIDETRFPDEEPVMYVERIARAKAASTVRDGVVVVAGDTAVVHEGHVLGKPRHPEEARAMLRRIQGGHHEVLTGLAVAGSRDETTEVKSLVDMTIVHMAPMTDAEIADYVDTGEPLDKAGAYGIGGLGGRFIEGVVGSPSTVAGLPIHLVPRLLAAFGIELSRTAIPPR
jgi:septum formation protein